MAEFPDVLDAMGKTPREFGALHVHLESLKLVDSGRYVATVLLQGAFEPMPPAVVEFLDGEVSLLRVDVPALEGGRVLRLRAPLRARRPLSSVGLRAECREPRAGELRVRPAWRLFDTVEVPTLHDMERDRDDVDARVMSGLMSSRRAGLHSARLLARVVQGGVSLDTDDVKVKVHKARVLPSVLTVELSPGEVRPLADAEFEVVWSVGQPVPKPPPLVLRTPVAEPEVRGERRWCRSCAWEAKPGEYEKARSCPSCDEPLF